MATQAPVNKQTLVQITYPQTIKTLTDTLNKEVKWNFLVRYFAKQSMSNITKERFFDWIQTPDQSFEGSCTPPFETPITVSNCFAKVHELARQILLPIDEEHDKNLEDLFSIFKNQSRQIQCFTPAETINIADDLLTHIERMTGCKLALKTESDKRSLFKNFKDLFIVPANQKLMDEEIDAKIKDMFAILEEEPSISAVRLAQNVRRLWHFPAQEAPRLLTDLSEFLVKHNPYNKTLRDILKEAIEYKTTQSLIDKSLIYRLPHCPFAIKIQRVEMDVTGNFARFKLTSAENSSAVLKVDTNTYTIVSLSFDRSVAQELSELTTKSGDSPTSFQVEAKMSISGICNFFESGKEYVLTKKTDKKGGVLGMGAKTYTNYVFTSEKHSSHSITFHVVENEQKFEITTSKDKKTVTQDMDWRLYQALFSVLTTKPETYCVTDTGGTRLDEHLLSLSKRGLATEGALKKALKERDGFTAEVLDHLINNQQAPKIEEGFLFINHHPQNALSEELYEAIFSQIPLFHRLCANRYVKERYGKGEGELLTPELQHRFGTDLLHEAQCLILSFGDPKAQQGNRDLIKNLCEVSQLTESIGSEVYAIPFIGSTGSGKSTTVSYMMGIPMEEFQDEFGETRIRHKETANNTLPKIGFALGLSETIHAKTFSLLPPPPFEKDLNDPFAEPPKHDPEFRGVLTRETLKLADFPGFFDTRGTHYEIITNFSIDRAMEAFKGVPAIIQVLPYENITADRARLLYSTLTELEAKFPTLLTNEKLQQRIHFVITKFGQIGKEHIKSRLEQLINEYRQDGLSGEKYFAFLLNQLLKQRMHLLNPLSSVARLDILENIIQSFSKDEEPIKSTYQGGFNDPKMQLRVGDVLSGAIVCWQRLLEEFLNKKTELHSNKKQSEEKTLVLQNSLEEEKTKSEALANLQAKQGKPFDPDDPFLEKVLNEIAASLEKQTKSYEQKIETLTQEIDSLAQEIAQNTTSIQELEVEVSKLGTGCIDEKLHQHEMKKGDKQTYSGTWKSHVDVAAKIRRQLDKGADNLSEHEEELEHNPHARIVGEGDWQCSRAVVLHKKYELVPSHLNEAEKLEKLNELAGGVGCRSVVLDDGSGWRIDVESGGDLKFIDIKVHDSGKKFMYGYEEKFHVSPPYPKLVIKAVLPCSVYNHQLIEEKKGDIKKLKDENAEKETRIAQKKGVKLENEHQLSQLKKQLQDNLKAGLEKAVDDAQTSLEVCRASIQTQKDEIEQLNIQKKRLQEKQKRYAVSIQVNQDLIEGTYLCTKTFKPTKSDISAGEMINKKNNDVLEKCQSFARLYDSKKKEIDADVKEILSPASA